MPAVLTPEDQKLFAIAASHDSVFDLDDAQKAETALRHLRRLYRDKDLDPCLEALGHRLAGWGEPALYQQFLALIPEGPGRRGSEGDS